jgi:hypothetical protein
MRLWPVQPPGLRGRSQEAGRQAAWGVFGENVRNKTLSSILAPRAEADVTLRWESAVPIATNPFLLMELFQFACFGGLLAIFSLCSGAWLAAGFVTMQEVAAAFHIGGMLIGGIMAGFVALAFLFFGNRYYAVYRMDATGVYHEGSRGHDAAGGLFSFRCKPYPVTGAVTRSRTRSRQLPWEKVDRFQAIPSMHVIILRRKFWHMLRLYMPDEKTYEAVAAFLAKRLQQSS